MNAKYQYDRAHYPQFLRAGDWALLRLYRRYDIPANKLTGRKYGQQAVGPFRVLERIGRLAYRLDIPEDWKIYDVFTITQLEPCPDPSDNPFKRPRPAKPGPVLTDRDDMPPEWELDRILDKRLVPRGRRVSTEYLLRWQGWGSEWDRWINVKNMNADELIAEYEQYITQKPVRKRGRPRNNNGTS